jgi:hypothetical protein
MSYTQDRGGSLTGDILPTAKFPAIGSPPPDSTRRAASKGTLGWLRGSPKQARQRPWRTAELRGGAPGDSGHDRLRRALLQIRGDLAKLKDEG